MKLHISYWSNQSVKPSCVFACFFGLDEEKNSEMIKVFKHETRNIENVHVIESTFNFKYIGRYQIALGAPTENIIMMDDDRFPRSQYAEFMLNILSWNDAIIGQDGWALDESKNDCTGQFVGSWFHSKDFDKVTRFEGDYLCGGMVFKKNHLFNLFSKPFATKTGEDILMCIRNKKAGIPTHIYVPSKNHYESIIAHNSDGVNVTRTNDELIDFRTKLIKEELGLPSKSKNKKLCIIQLSEKEYAEGRAGCVESVKTYCSSMGYEFRDLRDTLDTKTHIAYQKPLALMREIDSFEYVVWMDRDIFIANMNFDFYDYLHKKNQDITIARDVTLNELNSGVVCFKSSKLSKEILDEWWNARVIGTDKQWRQQAGNNRADQFALNKILKKHNIQGENPHAFNIFPRMYKKGDFAVHFMGHLDYDYEPFVLFANEHIKDQETLEYFLEALSSKMIDINMRFYEYGADKSATPLGFSPESVLKYAIKLKNL